MTARRVLGILAGALLVGLLVAWGIRARAQSQSPRAGAARQAPGAGRGGAAAAERPVPVEVATVERRDVPVYLEGLGNVAAFYTVTVRAQVEGVLQRVAFREGQAVHRGDLLAEIDPRPFAIALRQAEALVARDRATLRSNQIALERDRFLNERHFVAPQEFDNQRAAVEQLRAAVRADQAAADNARLQLGYTRVTSPIDGVTGVRQVDPGNLVRASDPNGLVVVTQVEPITVFFTLPEDDLPAITTEMSRGTLRVEAYSRDGATLLGAGDLALVDNRIDPGTATIRLKAVMPNPGHALWPEQFVKVLLLLTTRHDALVIPASAVQRGPRGTAVYVVGADRTVALRPVRVDSVQGELALIAGGLSAGDTVVVDGQARLRPGAAVDPRHDADGRGGGGGPTGAGRGP